MIKFFTFIGLSYDDALNQVNMFIAEQGLSREDILKVERRVVDRGQLLDEYQYTIHYWSK